jgi:transcriptional regulator with XRE-family HTH domain
MTTTQFAKRMGVLRARVSFMESSEIDDALTIRTLREAARLLSCRLVYFFVPEKIKVKKNVKFYIHYYSSIEKNNLSNYLILKKI